MDPRSVLKKTNEHADDSEQGHLEPEDLPASANLVHQGDKESSKENKKLAGEMTDVSLQE